jgi:hypothetical protein
MTELCEGVAVTQINEEDATCEKKPLKVRLILLYDGTMNNKTNIDSRISQNEFYQSTRAKKYKLFGERVGPGADSYENGFTNIAALDGYLEKQASTGFDITIKVYTEGAGTINNQGDKTLGYAMGVAKAGVINKCRKGLQEARDLIQNGTIGKSKINWDEHYIEKLTFDVFGFSRGAATARYAIYVALKDSTRALQKQLNLIGIETKQVEACFAGLFDTVSAHGVSFSDDVKDLHLDAIAEAQKVLHLAAADEHRENFSLTNIKSAGGKGEEYYLPGVHSDIGGSYVGGEQEDFLLLAGAPSAVKADMQHLIDLNWYSPQQLEYSESYPDEFGQIYYAQTKAKKTVLSSALCKIPLKLMAEAAMQQGLNLNNKVISESDAALQAYDDLKTLDQQITRHMANTRDSYNFKDPFICQIRNRYMHMSAKWSTGLKPRFLGKGAAAIRWRQIYDG